MAGDYPGEGPPPRRNYPGEGPPPRRNYPGEGPPPRRNYPGEGASPRRDHPDDSPYPPLPGTHDQHSRAIAHHTRPQMASTAVTLPSIYDRSDMYPPPTGRAWDPRLDQRDPRAAAYGPSPIPSSPYAPPPGAMPAHGGYSPANGGNPYAPPGGSHQAYLPPVHQQSPDSRTHSYYPAQNPGPFSGQHNAYDYAYRQDRGPPGPYTPEYGRGPAPPGSYPPEFARAAPPSAVLSHGQSAPRQRTSIACKYCRRRKIRCSGYANSPGGKCSNCIKMNQDCVFQPVSSTSSTAFVPVSALPNGVAPPGVPLYGAYGQPLPMGGPTPYPTAGQNFQANTPHYEQPLPSPTGSNNSYWDEGRAENTRRRQRMPDDEHGVRLPPPSGFPDDNTRRRSPCSSSPNRLQLLQPSHPQSIPHQGFDNRTPPPKGSPPGATVSGAPGSSVMNLENIMSSERNEDDKKMVGRLNFRAPK